MSDTPLTPYERADKLVRSHADDYSINPLLGLALIRDIAAALRETEAVMKERCAKVAEGPLDAADHMVQTEIAAAIRALE